MTLNDLTSYVYEGEPKTRLAPGVEGNRRLNASLGIALTGLLLVEGFTTLDVRGYITLHTAIGLLLIGPIALKTATTIYRFWHYYRGTRPYVERGAPPLVLRLIGPFVILSSVAVLGTGVMLLVDKGNSDTWLTLHQASFVVWLVLTGVHFLGHIVEAGRTTAAELSGASPLRGRAVRMLAVAGSLAVGIALAAAFTPDASSWHLHEHFGDRGNGVQGVHAAPPAPAAR